MKLVNLNFVDHDKKRGDKPSDIPPNICEDTSFFLDGQMVGFYLKKVPSDVAEILDFSNKELRSDRVPKSTMNRIKFSGEADEGGRRNGIVVEQYSTILGAIQARPHNRRLVANISSVHRKETAQTFIKLMLLLAKQAGNIINEICPEMYEHQKKIISKKVPKKFRFTDLFTSSISNYNIAANYHQDTANLPLVNVIFSKRENATGGNLTVPDFDLTFDCCDDSMIVYPAYKSLHGVTPIHPTSRGGYRNSLVFYPLGGLK